MIAFAAWRRAGDNEARLLALARAVDQTRPTSPSPVPSPTLDIETIASVVAREVERLAARSETGNGTAAENPASGIAPGASGNSRPPAPNVQPLSRSPSRGSVAGRQAAVSRAMRDGRLDIALQPIVSLAGGTAIAFDAFAEFDRDGAAFHLARLGTDVPTPDRARFEALLLARAIEAARRVMAGATEAPLHVSVSRALLASTSEATSLLERLRAHPAAAHAIVLDLAAEDLPASGTTGETLDAFVDAGAGLCLDVTDTRAPAFAGIRMSGARQVRLPAQRLLGNTAPRGQGPSGPDIAAAARDAGIAVIADRVATDDEALALADLGIDLMSGPRFAVPRRLRDARISQVNRTAAE